MFSIFRKSKAPSPSPSRLNPTSTSFTTGAVAPKQQYGDQHWLLDADTNSSTSNIGGVHSFSELPPHLFALVIGINNYESPNITNLVGAVPDADAVRDYLQNVLGVPSSQIKYLCDSGATRAAIMKEIEAFSSNNAIKEGDPILIYYAGHGGWANTPAGWEVGSTGKIELLIPYDCSSPLEDRNPKHGIPDRTLGALLSHLASKKGNNITVILDCCHSGSGTRNLDPTFKARTIDVGEIPSDLDRDVWIDFEALEGSRGTKVHSGFARKGLRSHVLLAACHSQELAYERTSRGVFTVALLKTLVDLGLGMDNLTYATLLSQMPPLSSGQNPQCEGFFRERTLFHGKVSSKRTSNVYYKISKLDGKTYVIPDAGEAAGITAGAEFEVYQDRNSLHLLGTVVARELSDFSTTLYAESGFALDRDGVALKSLSGREEQILVHVADSSLKTLVEKIDPNRRIIQLVGRDRAEFGMALEKGKVVFNIYDSDVRKYGLTRMPYIVEPTREAVTPVIRAAAHFYWHRRRTVKTGRGLLAEKVQIEVTELKLERVERDDELKSVGVYGPTARSKKGGKVFDLHTEKTYGWKIINNCNMPLYPALFYFDNSDWSIKPYYLPPIAGGIVDPPLKGKGHLTVGYGDSGWVPNTFFLREGQSVDVGTLKLFLSTTQVNLSHVAQSSPFASVPVGGHATAPSSRPFVPVGGHSTAPLSPPFVPIGGRSSTAPSLPFDSSRAARATDGSRGSKVAVLPEATNLPLPWDTIEIPVVQRRAGKYR